MNWEAIGASAELLGAIGVIVSLLYLATQIRQNTQSVRANTFQNFTRESAETTRLMLLERSLLDELKPLIEGGAEFDPGDHVRFGLIAGLWARNLQFGFMELQNGRMDPRQFESYLSYHAASWMRRPGWADWWALNRQHYDPEFVGWLEGKLATR